MGHKRKTFGMHWLGRGTQLAMKRADKKSLEGWVGTRWKTLEAGTKLTAKSAVGNPHIVTLLGAHRSNPLSVVDSRVSKRGQISMHVARGSRDWQITVKGDDISIRG